MQDSFVLPELQGGEANAVAVVVKFYTAAYCLPSSCIATIVASYAGQGSIPHVVVLDLRLPLTLFCQPVPPVKNAGGAITYTNLLIQNSLTMSSYLPKVCIETFAAVRG